MEYEFTKLSIIGVGIDRLIKGKIVEVMERYGKV